MVIILPDEPKVGKEPQQKLKRPPYGAVFPGYEKYNKRGMIFKR
jgi:hypothetical protein